MQFLDMLIKHLVCFHKCMMHFIFIQSDRGRDEVDALREAGDANSARLESINDSVSQIARDVSIMSNQPQQVAIPMKNLKLECVRV